MKENSMQSEEQMDCGYIQHMPVDSLPEMVPVLDKVFL